MGLLSPEGYKDFDYITNAPGLSPGQKVSGSDYSDYVSSGSKTDYNVYSSNKNKNKNNQVTNDNQLYNSPTFDMNAFMSAIQNMLGQYQLQQSGLYNNMLQNYNTNYMNMFSNFNDNFKNIFSSFNNTLNNMNNKNNQNWANYLNTNRNDNYLNNAMQYYKSNDNVNKTFNNNAQNDINSNFALDIWKDKL